MDRVKSSVICGVQHKTRFYNIDLINFQSIVDFSRSEKWGVHRGNNFLFVIRIDIKLLELPYPEIRAGRDMRLYCTEIGISEPNYRSH